MKRNQKKETKSRRPLKKLIALWVVFAMLVVPFANHVGKNDVKAEGESGTGGELAVSQPVDMTLNTLELSLEMETVSEGNTPVNLAVHSGDAYETTYTFLKEAQTVAGIKMPTAKGLEEGKTVKFEYKIYGVTDQVEKECTNATAFPENSNDVLLDDADKITDANKKIAIYAYVGGKADPNVKSVLQYVINIEFVDVTSLYANDTQWLDEQYKMVNTVINVSYPTTAIYGATYGIASKSSGETDWVCSSEQKFSKVGSVEVRSALYIEGSPATLLAYRELGTIQVTDDTTAPVIKSWLFVAVQGDREIERFDSKSPYIENNVYYGMENFDYVCGIQVADLSANNEEATWFPRDGALTASCGGETLQVSAETPDLYSIKIPADKLDKDSDNEIKYTIKDNMGNTRNGSLEIKIHPVTDHTTVESVKFLGDDQSDLITTSANIKDSKTVRVVVKSTKEIGKIALNDGTHDVFEQVISDNGDMSAQREYTVTADFIVPPEGTTASISYSDLKVNVYGKDVDTTLLSGTTTLQTILFDQTKPEITEPVLQEKTGDNGTWKTVATNGSDTYTTKLNSTYRYGVKVTDDANGSGVNISSIKAGDKSFVWDEASQMYIYDIRVDDYANGSLALIVQASDNVGNPADSVTLPTLKKLDEKFRVDEKCILASDGITDITGEVASGKTKYSNQQIYLKLQLSSAYEIDWVRLIANNKIYEEYNNAQITNAWNDITHRYTAEVRFALPKDVNVNEMINQLYVAAADKGSREITCPEKTADGTQPDIGSILYDITHPYAKVSAIEDKWYQNYSLDYEICSGTSLVKESDLVSANYTFSNCEDPKTVSLVKQESEEPTYRGTVQVPESSDPTGTLLQFAAQDMCQNNIAGTTEYRIKVDKHAPTIQFDVNGKTGFANPIEGKVAIATAVSDNLTIAQATITVTKPDGSSVVKGLCSGILGKQTISDNYTLDSLLGSAAADGDYTVTVNAADMSGRATSKTISFTVDNTIPVVTAKIADGTTAGKQPGKNFDGTVCDYFYRSNVTVELTYEDENIAASGVRVTDNNNVVNVTWQRIGTTNKYRASYVSTGIGAHVIKINAQDNAGNNAVEKQVVFIKDTEAPNITAVINGGMIYSENMGVVDLTSDATVAFSVSDANEDVHDFNYQLIKTVPDQLPVTADVLKTDNRVFGYTDEADYQVKVYSVDKAGNRSSERNVQFRVDKTAPELQITGTASGSTLNAGTTLTFSMTEAFWWDASGTITITRKASDSVAETAYKTIDFKPTARVTTMTETLSETGEYQVTFTGKDRAGHTAEAASYTVRIDTGKPIITLSGVSNNDKTTKQVEFQAQIEEDFYLTKSVSIQATRTYLDPTSYKEKIENLQITGYNPTAATTLIRNTFTEDGIYKIQVTCKDAAGNEDTQEVSFTIDKTKPVIDPKVMSAYEGTLTSFAWDYDLNDIIYDLTVCDAHMYLNGSEYDGTSEVEDGAYEMKITAEDELGNATEETVNFNLDTKAPTFIVTGVEDGEIKNEQYDINVSLQLDEDTLDEVTLNGSPVEIKDNAAAITVTEKGDYKLTMKAHDDAGNEAEKTISFTYGEKSHVLLYVLIGVGVLVVLGGGIAIILAAKKKKND